VAKKVEFLIKADGTVELEAHGYAGASCRAGTEAYEKALGGSIASRREKRETVKSLVEEKTRRK
jgi:hypothetical protein